MNYRRNVTRSSAVGRASATARDERGGALLELAVVIPIFVAVLALIFDAGMGFSAARTTTNAARSAARIAALSGEDRFSDFRALETIRGEYAGSRDVVTAVTVFRSPAGGAGDVPSGCAPGEAGVVNVCNVYDGATLDSLDVSQFAHKKCVGEIDEKWCPSGRKVYDGQYVGVAVWVSHSPTVGLLDSDDYELAGKAVFAMYFEP